MQTRLIPTFFSLASALLILTGCGSGNAAKVDSETSSSAGLGDSDCANEFIDVTSDESSAIETVCLETNSQRLTSGATALKLDTQLTELAQAHARDMATRSYFSHTNPDGDDPFDRLQNAGVNYQAAAENIARGQTTPVAVMTSWMNSPGHRTNILGTRYRKLGVGSYQGHWVQIFTD